MATWGRPVTEHGRSERVTHYSETVPDGIPATVLRLRSSRSALPDAVVPIQIRPTPPLSEMRPLGLRLRSGALRDNIARSTAGLGPRARHDRAVRALRSRWSNPLSGQRSG